MLPYDPFNNLAWDPFSFIRRRSRPVIGIGNGTKVKMISNVPPDPTVDLFPESIEGQTCSYEQWKQYPELLDDNRSSLLLEQGT